MSRNARRSTANAGELNLTAMIDVAFQLLSFFIITAKPVDALANLDIMAPSAEKAPEASTPPKVLRITTANENGREVWLLNDYPVEFSSMEPVVMRTAADNRGQTVLIQCDPASRHEMLVQALNLCAKAGLTNLSVVTANERVGTLK
jgi:biopolymer transport protein ExbD